MTKFILEMDKDVEECLCLDESGNGCNFISKRCLGDLQARPKWCPLVEEEDKSMMTITTLEERLKRIEERLDTIEMDIGWLEMQCSRISYCDMDGIEKQFSLVYKKLDWLMSFQEHDRAITINEANEVVAVGKSLNIGLEEWVK